MYTIFLWAVLIFLVACLIAGPLSLIQQMRMAPRDDRGRERWHAYLATQPPLRRFRLRYWNPVWWWVKAALFAWVFIVVMGAATNVFSL